MSTNLYWKPVFKNQACIGKQIKYHLAPKLWEHDGTLCSEWTLVGSELLPFLEGLASAGNKEVSGEAKKLMSLIKKHGDIEIALIT